MKALSVELNLDTKKLQEQLLLIGMYSELLVAELQSIDEMEELEEQDQCVTLTEKQIDDLRELISCYDEYAEPICTCEIKEVLGLE